MEVLADGSDPLDRRAAIWKSGQLATTVCSICSVPSRTAQRREAAQQGRPPRIAERARRWLAAGAILAAALLVVIAALTDHAGGAGRNAATGAPVDGASASQALLSGIPQRGLVLGSPRAPVRVVEFADLQCPYCDEFAVRALPTLIDRYVRTSKISIEFRNLAFIGPGSVSAARVAAAAALQDELWDFVELMYDNQGEENSGYVTSSYLHRLLAAIPGLDVAQAERESAAPQAQAMLNAANIAAQASDIDSTPSFLIGRAGGPLYRFAPASLTAAAAAAAFAGALDRLIGEGA